MTQKCTICAKTLSNSVSGPGQRDSLLTLLVELEVADGLAGIRGFLRLLDCFLEFLFQEIRSMLLRFHRLAENGFAPAVLLFHGTGGLLDVTEHFGLYGRGVSDDSFRLRIDFEHGATARTSNLEGERMLRHQRNDTANRGYCGVR